MGKKRRLKSSAKFGAKHANHPRMILLKKAEGQAETVAETVAETEKILANEEVAVEKPKPVLTTEFKAEPLPTLEEKTQTVKPKAKKRTRTTKKASSTTTKSSAVKKTTTSRRSPRVKKKVNTETNA